MQLGINIQKSIIYFVLLGQNNKFILRKRKNFDKDKYLQTITDFTQDILFYHDIKKDLTLKIVISHDFLSLQNSQKKQKLVFDIQKHLSLKCFFYTLISCLGLASAYLEFWQKNSVMTVMFPSFEAVFLLKKQIVAESFLGKWSVDIDNKGKEKYLKEYLLSATGDKNQKYRKLIITIVNLYDPELIVFFFDKKDQENFLLTNFQIHLFQKELATKITVSKLDEYALAHGAALQKK